MTKRLRFKTALTCGCGARGELTWEEDDFPGRADQPLNYQVVGMSGPFVAASYGRAICNQCNLTDDRAPAGLATGKEIANDG
jgi:hypothetical protein